jgi:tetrahydromethanopterin S-methyltransferase subunit G
MILNIAANLGSIGRSGKIIAMAEMVFSPRSSRKDDLNYSDDLNDVINTILSSSHPLDAQKDFDVVEFINIQFPDIESLGGLHEYALKLRAEIATLEDEIYASMGHHAFVAAKSGAEIQSVRDSLTELSSRINSIRDRSEESERIVKTVSRDIVFLDTAKKNVGLTINTLKKLVMMVNACEQLAELAGSREYNQTPALIISIRDLESSLEEIKHIPRVAEFLQI